MKLTDFTVIKEPIAHVRWEEIKAKMSPEQYGKFAAWMIGQTCIEQGVYPWDLDRFLKGLPIID